MQRVVGLATATTFLAVLLAVSGCGSTTTTVSTASSSVGNGANVSVSVTSPTSGAVMAASSVTVRGTVDPPNATVQVQGKAAAVGNGVFTGSAELHGGKTTIDIIGSAPGDSPGSTSVEVTRQSSGGSSGASSGHAGGSSGGGSNATPGIAGESPGESSGGQTACGGGLSVGPDTTCAFAQNVRSAYENEGGAGTHEVYSPVTEKTYSMTCSSGAPVICRGANNASVYFP
jgi:hypothetical protein